MANILYLLMIVGLLVVLLCAHAFDKASRESGTEEPRENESDGGLWTTFWTTCKNTPWTALLTIPWFAPWATPWWTVPWWAIPRDHFNHRHAHPDIEDPVDQRIYYHWRE